MSYNSIDRLVADNLRRIRLTSGLTLAEVSDVVGITYQSIFRIETHKMSVRGSRLLGFAKAFNCSVEDFYIGARSTLKEPHQLESTKKLGRFMKAVNAIKDEDILRGLVDASRGIIRAEERKRDLVSAKVSQSPPRSEQPPRS